MSEVLAIDLMEPAVEDRRRAVAHRLGFWRGRDPEGRAPDPAQRLLQVRRRYHEEAGDLDALTAAYRDRAAARLGSANVVMAPTAAAAAAAIVTFGGDGATYHHNKSGTLKHEILPALRSLLAPAGRVTDSYAATAARQGSPPRPARVGTSLFAGASFGARRRVDVPTRTMPEMLLANTVALLGVSWVSVEGACVFTQHLDNIPALLERMQRLVFVVPVDRIARTDEDAWLFASCMGTFGARAVHRELVQVLSTGAAVGDAAAPAVSAPPPDHGRVLFVLLDNGRRALAGGEFEDLLRCIGCRGCLAECPAWPHFRGGQNPKEYLAVFLREPGVSGGVSDCLHCGLCQPRCPLDIRLPTMIARARARGGGLRLRDRLLSEVGLVGRLGPLSVVANRLAGSAPARVFLEKTLGIVASVKLPPLAAAGSGRARGRGSGTRAIALYSGCGYRHLYPEVRRHTRELFERLGMEVLEVPHRCCGLPQLANGFLRRARASMAANAKALLALGLDVVTPCTSCAFSMKREYPEVLGGGPEEGLSARVFTVSQYLVLLLGADAMRWSFRPAVSRAHFHPSCHLRALGPLAVDAHAAILREISGLDLDVVDEGCCGMAGTFGLKAEKASASRAIGAPVIAYLRAQGRDRVVTDCPTCRIRLENGLERHVTHTVSVLAEHLVSGEAVRSARPAAAGVSGACWPRGGP